MPDFSLVDITAGVDEAGRGPLAGPVIAAAVILDKNSCISGLADSKTISPLKRRIIADEIHQHALSVGIGRADPDEIDEINILQATMLAMVRAINSLAVTPELVLVDGNRKPNISWPVQCIVRGDSLVPEISAASIIAKVARDLEMLELDSLYPGYGFAKHKGYPTVEHISALRRLGPCPVHRKSFRPVQSAGLHG